MNIKAFRIRRYLPLDRRKPYLILLRYNYGNGEMLYRILLVDDDKRSIDLFTEAFEHVFHRCVLIAAVSTNAVEIMSGRVDLVLLNLHLKPSPGGGIEIARRIRENGYIGPLWIFNGDSCPELLFSAMLAGVDEFLLKCDSDDLVAQIEQTAAGCAVSDRSTDASLISASGETALLSRVIRHSPYLRTAGLSERETGLLGEFAVNGYPRLKEFSGKLEVSESSLWKRFARIRDKLHMDSMSQIAHLVTLLSMMETRREHRRRLDQSAQEGLRNRTDTFYSVKP